MHIIYGYVAGAVSSLALGKYLDDGLNNDGKRTILTKLFDEVVYKGDVVSIQYKLLAQSIADRSLKTKEILEDTEMLNQTTKKDPNDRGQSVEKSTQELLFPIWQRGTCNI